MSALEASLPAGRALRAVDVALSIWAVLWIVLAIVIADQLQGLAELSDTVASVGEAAEASGAALALAADVPLLGDAFGPAIELPAQEIQEAGRSAQASGESSRRDIDLLTALLAPAIALMPSIPILALYLPARISRRREAETVGDARRRAGDDPRFREFLARRAAQKLSYRQLSDMAFEPWRELADGRYDRLARAELERLGLESPVRQQHG